MHIRLWSLVVDPLPLEETGMNNADTFEDCDALGLRGFKKLKSLLEVRDGLLE